MLVFDEFSGGLALACPQTQERRRSRSRPADDCISSQQSSRAPERGRSLVARMEGRRGELGKLWSVYRIVP
jgi:hypothetical protein